ncbi:hypothetical protein F5884DRAFT_756628 [Xylogone sp. PMI_703]|nr:hypothetical protein F5884DRAFT_756628 [Xylogone sp. PMI_703]
MTVLLHGRLFHLKFITVHYLSVTKEFSLQATQIDTNSNSEASSIWQILICPHVHLEEGGGTRCVNAYLDPTSPYHPTPLSKGLEKCRFCATEFRVDFKNINGSCLSMFVTTWKNLGQGVSHLDPDWQRHIDKSGSMNFSELDLELGSLCSTFEQRRFRFDSIISPKEAEDMMRIYWAHSRGSWGGASSAYRKFAVHHCRRHAYAGRSAWISTWIFGDIG